MTIQRTIPAKVRSVLRTGVCYPEDVVARLSGVPRKPIIAALRRMGEAGAVIRRNDGRVLLADCDQMVAKKYFQGHAHSG